MRKNTRTQTIAPTTITPRERAEIDAANASGRRPVVFVHGLWLLAGSWQNWKDLFEAHGYAAVAVDW
jgi:non-heme chloroperoxidase